MTSSPPDRSRPRRSLVPRLDPLECRCTPTAGGAYTGLTSYRSISAKHAYDRFVTELQRIELGSFASPAEYLALRDDTRALSNVATAAGPAANAPGAQTRLTATTLLIDRSLLEGWLSDQGWNEVHSKLATTLAPFNVPPALLDQTVTDMRQAATDAGVDPGAYQVLYSDIASAQSARDQLQGGNSANSYRDPQVYYTQHLRGFFRGWAQQRVVDAHRLPADVARLVDSPPGRALVSHDVALLERLGAPIPSTAFQTLTDAYATVLETATPTSSDLATFRNTATAALGATATPSRIGYVNQLIADAPATAGALKTPASVQTLLADVRAVVNDGQGTSLNPFLIAVFPGGSNGVS